MRASSSSLQRAAGALLAACIVAGCGTPSAPPPPTLHRLALEPPAAVRAVPASTEAWEIAGDVPLPRYLERDRIVVARGDTGLEALAAHRWAEPLRDSVPRLLRHDLGRLRGSGHVWPAPAPLPARRLKVEVLSLLAHADRGAVVLHARWSLTDARGGSAPQVAEAELQVPLAEAGPDAIVRAHRLALWRLAERIAGVG